MSSRNLRGGRYAGAIAVDAPAQAENITVTITTAGRVNDLDTGGWGWHCSGGDSAVTCTTDASKPHTLFFVVKWHPHAEGRSLSATVSAPGNDDPNSGNNGASLVP
jgi:hypothetical protein